MPIPLFALKIKISLSFSSLLLKVQSLIKIVMPFVLALYSNAKTYVILNINQPLIGASFGQRKRWLHIVSGLFHSSDVSVLCSSAYPVTLPLSASSLRSILASPDVSFVLPFASLFMYIRTLHCGQYCLGCELVD